MSADSRLAAALKYQHTINQKVLRAMRSRGDKWQADRDVRHWSYFPTAEASATFAKRIESAGFEIVYRDNSTDRKRPFCLCYDQRKVNVDVLDQSCAKLQLWTEDLDGEYDGWETELNEVQ